MTTEKFDPDAYYLHIGDKPVVGPKNGYTEEDTGKINKTVEDTKNPDYVKAGEYKFQSKEIILVSPLGVKGEEQWTQK